jgi:alkanesulfonate monooxygenase SsuD/methylene tetrahydromethanopterin reductase-like flavin-dependent oxidoreductase (luciferase family)
MNVGMTLPSMARDFDRDAALAWCRGIDGGPFASLACGERVTYFNAEMRMLLGAAAALTERVRIVPTLYVLPMHAVAQVAKEVATLDVLSGGRVTLAVGVGGREHDYRALERSFEGRFRRMDTQVAELRRLWSGEPPFEGADPVGPAPVQPGGPPIWAGAMGPKSLRRVAKWADGVAGFSLAGDPEQVSRAFEAAEEAWRAAGRSERPRRVSGFWYALGPGARDRLEAYGRDYLRIFGDGPAAAIARTLRIDSVSAFRDAVARIEEYGCDELLLVPTSADPAELDRTIDALTT